MFGVNHPAATGLRDRCDSTPSIQHGAGLYAHGLTKRAFENGDVWSASLNGVVWTWSWVFGGLRIRRRMMHGGCFCGLVTVIPCRCRCCWRSAAGSYIGSRWGR